jgi:hypothetical protein
MRAAAKLALAAAPFVAVFLLIRGLGRGEGERWRERVLDHCPGAVVGVEEPELIVVATDRDQARAAADEVREFRRALSARYGDLLGRPRFERMVIVVFPDAAGLQAYAGATMRADRDAAARLHGYTDPSRGAVFVPADALGTLRHETVHWVMETSRGAERPTHSPWLSEGLAQLFETLDPSDPRPPVARVTLPPGDIDLDRLIRIEDYSLFVGSEGLRNYREALAVCAFLLETRPRALREYVEAELRSATGRAAVFGQIFRHDEEPFRGELRTFVERLGR